MLQSIYMQEESIHQTHRPFEFIMRAYEGLGQVIGKDSKVIMRYEDTVYGLLTHAIIGIFG